MPLSSEVYAKLRNMVKPKDMQDSPVFNDNPTPLKVHTGLTPLEETALAQDHIYFMSKKPSKKGNHGQNMWDVDISASGPGHFDDAGNFILSRSKKTAISWLVKLGNVVEGPFTEREIKAKAETGELDSALIKRDFDKGFVEAKKLMKSIPDFFTGENLNKYFVENQVIEQKAKTDEFYSSVITREKNSKLGNFMKKFNINASPEFIIKTITGMRKAEAIDSIGSITGLDRSQNQILIELLIEDSKTQILKDVDKDGFEINNSRKNSRGFYRK